MLLEFCFQIYGKEWDCWIIRSSIFSFLKNLSCSPRWLHQLIFLPPVLEGSLFSASSPTLEFVVFDVFL